jgi:hypothetical protein
MSAWDAATYRERELRWRNEAKALPPGSERDECCALADGYAKLVSIIDQSMENTDIISLYGVSPVPATGR